MPLFQLGHTYYTASFGDVEIIKIFVAEDGENVYRVKVLTPGVDETYLVDEDELINEPIIE